MDLNLQEWLEKEDKSPSQFAEESKGAFSASTVYHWIAGIRNPTDENKKIVFRLSNREVTRWNGATVTFDC